MGLNLFLIDLGITRTTYLTPTENKQAEAGPPPHFFVPNLFGYLPHYGKAV